MQLQLSVAPACGALVVFASLVSEGNSLKGHCTVFQHALKSLEITGIVLSLKNVKNCTEKFQKVKML